MESMKYHYIDNYLINPTHRITINIVGIGGTGSHLAYAIADIAQVLEALGHPGIQCVLYDDDIVTEHNLGRSKFTVSDVGLNKAIAVTTNINRTYGFDWEAFPDKYSGTPANITISCVDTIKSRKKIVKLIKDNLEHIEYKKQLYLIDVGNSKDYGQVILSTIQNINQPKSKYKVVSKLKGFLDIYKEELKGVNDKDEPSCSTFEALNKQDLLVNKFAATMVEKLLWDMFRSVMLDYHGMFFNLNELKINKLKIK